MRCLAVGTSGGRIGLLAVADVIEPRWTAAAPQVSMLLVLSLRVPELWTSKCLSHPVKLFLRGNRPGLFGVSDVYTEVLLQS